MIYQLTLTSGPQEGDIQSFNDFANHNSWASLSTSPATEFMTVFLSWFVVVDFFNAITFRLKFALLDMCFRRNMIWRKSAKVKYLFGQGLKDISSRMVTEEKK